MDTIYKLLLLIVISTPAFASKHTFEGFGAVIDEQGIQPAEFSRVNNIMDIASYVTKLIDEKKVSPADILVIVDIDGTLTNEPEPSDEKGAPSTLRKNAKEAVNTILQKNVAVIASSAWTNPAESYERLIKLGLKEQFKLGAEPALSLLPNYVFITFKSGNFAAVKNPNVDKKYFRQKAFSPHAIFNTNDIKFKYVILADDSFINIAIFYKDVLSPDKPYHDGTHFTFFYMD